MVMCFYFLHIFLFIQYPFTCIFIWKLTVYMYTYTDI